jgi:hypothetical protein
MIVRRLIPSGILVWRGTPHHVIITPCLPYTFDTIMLVACTAIEGAMSFKLQ